MTKKALLNVEKRAAHDPCDYTIPMKYGSDIAVFVARIIWDKPNRLWDR